MVWPTYCVQCAIAYCLFKTHVAEATSILQFFCFLIMLIQHCRVQPSFSLERPVCRLKMDKRLEVHNNFISAISNKMHKLDLICRLMKSEPHNAVHYQRQLNQHLMQHDDVIHQLINIMKADDYFTWTEDLPLIDPLTTHEEIMKFPELFDVHEAASRVTTGVDILERHMQQPGMYLVPQSPIPLHLALYLTGLVQHLNPYTWLHHQLHPDKLHEDHQWCTGVRNVSRQLHTMCTKVTSK